MIRCASHLAAVTFQADTMPWASLGPAAAAALADRTQCDQTREAPRLPAEAAEAGDERERIRGR